MRSQLLESHALPLIKTCLTTLLNLMLVGSALGQSKHHVSEESVPSNLFQFEMDDKTRVIGTPDIAQLNLDMGFDRISIPIQRVQSIKRARQTTGWSESRFVVELANRDRFTGSVMNEAIRVRFLAGEVVLPVKQIQSLKSVCGWG